MKIVNSPWLTLIITGCFCVLASFAYGSAQPLHIYTQAKHATWKTNKAAIIAFIYNLAPDDVAKPVELFK